MRLTDAQEAMAAAVQDQWLAAALDSAPADRAAAEAGVREAYRLVGLAAPERMFWFGSPRAGAMAAALMSGAPGPAAPDWVGEVYAELCRQGWRPGEAAGPSVRRQVRTEPWAAARAAASRALGADGWAQVSAAAGRQSWALVMDLVASRLRLRLGEDLSTEPGAGAARPHLMDAIYGQHDGAWLATFDAAARLRPGSDAADGPEQTGLGPTGWGRTGLGPVDGLAGLAAVARHCGWWWANTRVAILTERPRLLTRDNVGRLHRGDGAAMEFRDGYGLWAWRGMPIPAGLASELPRLTVARVREEPNAEIRRVMLEHFGYERYLRECGARRLGSDAAGTLWHLDLPGDEPLVMVEVVNATPEPDGTSRIYWLRVPPTVRTAREGVAWTFGLDEGEYRPLVQT